MNNNYKDFYNPEQASFPYAKLTRVLIYIAIAAIAVTAYIFK